MNGAIWPFVNHCSERRGENGKELLHRRGRILGKLFRPEKTQECMQTNKAIDIDGQCGECCCSVFRNNGGERHTSGEK
ncbi:MAG: hypothetical protein DMF30_00350 [Verrucomicrobia bacterium]|nr:MAG: hypothetical protein DMF30_00350 [Verrucomicrobiota bacterium]